MPVCGDNTVLFRTTLFALVRTSINMTSKDKTCFRENNFRRIIRKLWPNTPQRFLDVLLPEQSGNVCFSMKFEYQRDVYHNYIENNCCLSGHSYGVAAIFFNERITSNESVVCLIITTFNSAVWLWAQLWSSCYLP